MINYAYEYEGPFEARDIAGNVFQIQARCTYAHYKEYGEPGEIAHRRFLTEIELRAANGQGVQANGGGLYTILQHGEFIQVSSPGLYRLEEMLKRGRETASLADPRGGILHDLHERLEKQP